MRDDTLRRCPSELELDRWALAGRPAAHAVPVHAAACPECRERLAYMERAEAMVAPHAFATNVQEVLDRAEALRAERRRPWAWFFEGRGGWALAAAAACLLLVAVVPREPTPTDPVGPGAGAGVAPSGVEGWKAGEGVALQVLVGGEPTPAGATLASGVVLTLRLSVARPGHLALVSLEQGGRVSRVLPAKGARPTPVAPGVVVTQGGVAAASGVERLYVLFDERPFDLDAALREVQAAARGDLGAGAGAGLPLDLARDQGPRVAATWWFRHGEVQP